MSTEVQEFVKKLLKTSPAKKHSIQLEIDTDGDVCGLFEVLLMIMTDILKKWYPPPITIGKISDEDLLRLQDYFASFGIKLQLEIQPEIRATAISNRSYLQKTKLEDMTFQMSNDGKRYTVRFSNIPIEN